MTSRQHCCLPLHEQYQMTKSIYIIYIYIFEISLQTLASDWQKYRIDSFIPPQLTILDQHTQQISFQKYIFCKIQWLPLQHSVKRTKKSSTMASYSQQFRSMIYHIASFSLLNVFLGLFKDITVVNRACKSRLASGKLK